MHTNLNDFKEFLKKNEQITTESQKVVENTLPVEKDEDEDNDTDFLSFQHELNDILAIGRK